MEIGIVTEELIKEAKRRYPVGTVYVPAHVNKGLMEVTSHTEGMSNQTTDSCIVFQSKIIEGNWLECVWDNYNGWARIVSLPEDYILPAEVINEYQIY